MLVLISQLGIEILELTAEVVGSKVRDADHELHTVPVVLVELQLSDFARSHYLHELMHEQIGIIFQWLHSE